MSTQQIVRHATLLVVLSWSVAAWPADYFGDGDADVLVRNTASGAWRLYDIDNDTVTGSSDFALPANGAWAYQASPDFDGDGDNDVLLRNANGNWQWYQVQNGTVVGSAAVNLFKSRNWVLQTVLDADGDGDSDVVLRNVRTGGWRLHTIQNGQVVATAIPSIFKSSAWAIRGAGDFDGDGDDDLLLRHETQGRFRVFEVEDGDVVGNADPGTLFNHPLWLYVASGDFDGDGTDDVLQRHANSGGWRISRFRDGRVLSRHSLNLPKATVWEFRDAGDFDGDGDTDLLLRRVDGGLWRINAIQNLAPVATSDIGVVRALAFVHAIEAPFERNADALIESYLNGRVRVVYKPLGKIGRLVKKTVNFSGIDITGAAIFDGADYVFDETASQRRRRPRNHVPPGRYQMIVARDLTPAVPGLGTRCLVPGNRVITITPEGRASQFLGVRCGTPTRKLSNAQLAAATPFTPVLQKAELFSVCLGNGGSDRIYGLPEDDASDIGNGVVLVEDLLELPALITSNGDGLKLFCRAMGHAQFGGTVIDEPLWTYLTRLDVLNYLDLAGGFEDPSDGSYGNPEVLSLLAPYQALLNASPVPYGVLPGTPTRRLQYLDFSFNTFNNAEWSDLWRISAANNYTVGDTRSLNNFGIIYSFGLRIDVTNAARTAIQQAGTAPVLRIEPSPSGVPGEGIDNTLEFPLGQPTALVFGPYDLGTEGADPLLVSVDDLPGGVACSAPGLTLENGIGNEIDGYAYRPYGTTEALTIDCRMRPNTHRLAATFAFPTNETFDFPDFSGSITALLRDSGGTLVDSRVLSAPGLLLSYFYAIDDLDPGAYTLTLSIGSGGSGFGYGCGNGGSIAFTMGNGNRELGTMQCSESTSSGSLGDGLMAQCLRRAGVDFLHQAAALPVGGRLDCRGLRGDNDFEVLSRPFASRILDLRDTGLSQSDLQTLGAVQVNDAGPHRLLLRDNPGVAAMTNADFLALIKDFDQVSAFPEVFPKGAGLIAQCLRRNNLAVTNDDVYFQSGDRLDCSGLRGADDFDVMRGYLALQLFRDSIFDFRDTALEVANVESLIDNVPTFPKTRRIILTGNPGATGLGNVPYIDLTRRFKTVSLGKPFPVLTYVKASDNQPGAAFGSRVQLDEDGSTLVVSADRWSSNLYPNLGRVYVFERSAAGWTETTRLLPPFGERTENARFGRFIALSADGNSLAAVRNLDINEAATVDLFRRTGAGAWVREASLTGSERFGTRLLFHNQGGSEYLLIGDPSAVGVFSVPSGQVTLYRRVPSGTGADWQFVRSYAPDAAAADPGDNFGTALAVDYNGYVLIGSSGDDSRNPESFPSLFDLPLTDDDDTNAGVVYVFPRVDSASADYAVYKDSSRRPLGDAHQFGRQLATLGSSVVIAARHEFVVDFNLFPFTSGVSSHEFTDRIDSEMVGIHAGGPWVLRRSRQNGRFRLDLVSPFGSAPQVVVDYDPVTTAARRSDAFGITRDISGDGNAVVFGASSDDSDAAGINGNEADESSVGSGAVYVYP